jgi:hypothetical protein
MKRAAIAVAILLVSIITFLARKQLRPQARTATTRRVSTAPTTRLITVEAMFLQSPGAEKKLEDSKDAWLPPQGNAQRWPRFLSDRERDALVRLARADINSSIVTTPRLTLASGQPGEVLVERQTAYVKDLKPKRTTTGPTTLEAVIDIARTGITFGCTATLPPDGKVITLALRPKSTSLIDMTTQPWKGSPAGQTIQVPQIREASLDTTLAMPPDTTAVYRITPRRIPATQSTQPSDFPVLLLIRPKLIR